MLYAENGLGKKKYIELNKSLNELCSTAASKARRSVCELCGKQVSSFCKSHSVPRLILERIANDGYVIHSLALIGLESIDKKSGIGNSGVFYVICNECDSRWFQDYENARNLENKLFDKMLAEIALKDSLVRLWQARFEIEMLKCLRDYEHWDIPDNAIKAKEFDAGLYEKEIAFYKNAITNEDRENNYQILFKNILPYRTPIAVETEITLLEDLKGIQVNNVDKLVRDNRLEFMHICVFPMESTTLVLAFTHKRDKKYRNLFKQIQEINSSEALKYINWLIIKYSTNYFFSNIIKDTLENNRDLQRLSREVGEYSNLGIFGIEENDCSNRLVSMDEIPNLLDRKYAL